eukprot:357798-Chlamydomonas_euryale.AAC.3
MRGALGTLPSAALSVTWCMAVLICACMEVLHGCPNVSGDAVDRSGDCGHLVQAAGRLRGVRHCHLLTRLQRAV